MTKKIETIIDSPASMNELINTKYGKQTATILSETKGKERIFIPTTIGLDAIIGGGIVGGTYTLLSGRQKVGKTTTALCIAANAQKVHKLHVWYFKIEARLQQELIDTIPILDPSMTTIIESKPGNILKGEGFLQCVVDVGLNYPRAVIVLDSLPALVSETEYSEEMSQQQMGSLGRMMGKFLRKISNAIAVNELTIIAISRIQQTQGQGASYTYIIGGVNQLYQADYIIKMKKGDYILHGTQRIGHWIEFETEASLDSPYQTALVPLIYGKALDTTMEAVYLAESLGWISKKGPWYAIEDKEISEGKNIKAQGQLGFIEILNDPENAKIKSNLFDKLKTIYK